MHVDFANMLRRAGAIVLLGSGMVNPLSGQSLPPPESVNGAMTRAVLDAGPASSATSGQITPTASANTLGGRLPVQLGITLNGYFDDNIFGRPDGPGRVGDFIWSLAPMVAWNSASLTGAAASVQLAYAPTVIFYQDHSGEDTVDQSATAIFGYESDRLTFVFSETYGSVQENSADENRLVVETTSTTTAQLNYQVTAKTSLEATARQTYTDDDPGLRTMEWNLSSYLDYQATAKTYFGLGDVVGVVDLEGPNQTYQQFNGRIGYDPDAKLSFNATAGLEFRQTQGHSGTQVTPDFSIGTEYEPFEGTDLGLSAYRRYDYSGRFYGDDYLATGTSVSISQRFLRRFHFSLAGTFEDAQYRDNFEDANARPAYDYFSVRPVFTYQPKTTLQFQLYYQYRQSLAQGGVAAFTDNQAGFSAQFTY